MTRTGTEWSSIGTARKRNGPGNRMVQLRCGHALWIWKSCCQLSMINVQCSVFSTAENAEIRIPLKRDLRFAPKGELLGELMSTHPVSQLRWDPPLPKEGRAD